MESRESSSPIVTRAVAAALQNRFSDPYDFPAWQKAALRVVGRLPQGAAQYAVPRAQSPGALDPDAVRNLSIDTLVANRLEDYAGLTQRYPAVTVGVAQGGATAHLSLAAGGPFLPQAFVLTLKEGSLSGDVQTYFRRSADLALHLAETNPNILTIQHYDPVHDGWLTRHVNHLRLKLLNVPPGYKEFLFKRLEPGGEVIYLEGQASWLRYRVGSHSVFQVGGWGDISDLEFLEGSPRLEAYCRQAGITETEWALPNFATETGAESEWGSEPGLGEALEAFCAQEGYRFTRLSFPDPNDVSRLAFQAVRRLLEKEGRSAPGVVVETFSQYDATAVMRTGLLPLWLIFNTMDSLRFLESMTPEFPAGLPVFFSPLATFSVTPDLVPWEEWMSALKDFDWINIGARKTHYPADALRVVNWMKPLRQWAEKHDHPVTGRLSGEELLSLSRSNPLRGN